MDKTATTVTRTPPAKPAREATSSAPRLTLREYDVQLPGWPRKRIMALSSEAAELEYRRLLVLRRPNLDISIVDITAQRERNNGLTDLEAKQAREQQTADLEMAKTKAVKAVEVSTAEAKAKATEFLAATKRLEERTAQAEGKY
jgi:hypothetical protein